MRTFTIAAAAAGLLAASIALAPAANATPSCVAQSATTFDPTTLGPAISTYARDYRPLGAIISFEATSPKDNCPPE
ncbi:MAG TPA: hypothetical protein VFX15_07620 [Actinomycetes bacterium]|nr:hypothetical protein [Actinomycetes bacterium]